MSAADNPFLIDAVELAARLDEPDVRVIDASWYLPDQGRDANAEYLNRRIPGSVFFDIDTIADGSSGLPHTLASSEAFATAVGALGIAHTDTIVVLDGLGLFSAARAWWNFRFMGASDVLILDGGLPAWEESGLPLESGTPEAPRPAVFQARPRPDRLAALDDVRRHLSDGSAVVVDVRAAPRFEGSVPEPRPGMRAGHMPGAINLPYAALVEDGHLRSNDELEAVFARAGLKRADRVVTSCGSGVTATIALLALESIGHVDNALYDGSWSEWGGRDDTDVVCGSAASNDTIRHLLGHRSIRKFTDRAVPDDTVRTLVACGQASATSSNVQATTVIQVRDPDTRAAFAKLAGGQPWIEQAAVFLVWCADLKRASDACAREGGDFEAGMTEHFIISTVDVALAAQSAVIAAESLGLGICYIGGIRNDPAQSAELLGLPDQVYPVFGLCLGWPDQDPEVKPRLPLDAVLMQERYDNDTDMQQLVGDYDGTLEAYYAKRSTNNKSSTWSQAMRALVGKESRPWMREFLAKRGFAMR